ncbi:MAG: PilZ domain-containing protein [Elusimicrobiota bacterium]
MNEKRKFIRVDYELPVKVETGDVAVPSFEGRLKDISAQGLKIESHEKIYPGTAIRIGVEINDELFSLVGYIRWMKEKGIGYILGIMLDESHAEHNNKTVEKIIEKVINEKERK